MPCGTGLCCMSVGIACSDSDMDVMWSRCRLDVGGQQWEGWEVVNGGGGCILTAPGKFGGMQKDNGGNRTRIADRINVWGWVEFVETTLCA